MAARPPRRRCPQQGCPHPSPCPTHQRRTDAPTLIRPNANFYNSREWRTLSRLVLDEQRHCPGLDPDERCGQRTTQADHIIPIEDGGPRLDRTNIQGLCARHHSIKTSRERKARTPGYGC